MADNPTLRLQTRTAFGKWAVRRLRAEGLVPGIVYGHGQPEVAVQMPDSELARLVRHGSRLLNVIIDDGANDTVFMRELQWHPIGTQILHVDLERIAADQRITVEVPLVLRGTAPGVEAGGALNQTLHNVQVECLVTEIPQDIRVNLRDLQLGQAIHVRDLVPPPGVRILNDPDLVVVQVTERVEAEAVVEAAEPSAAEPEIVGRRVAAEEPEGEAE